LSTHPGFQARFLIGFRTYQAAFFVTNTLTVGANLKLSQPSENVFINNHKKLSTGSLDVSSFVSPHPVDNC